MREGGGWKYHAVPGQGLASDRPDDVELVAYLDPHPLGEADMSQYLLLPVGLVGGKVAGIDPGHGDRQRQVRPPREGHGRREDR